MAKEMCWCSKCGSTHYRKLHFTMKEKVVFCILKAFEEKPNPTPIDVNSLLVDMFGVATDLQSIRETAEELAKELQPDEAPLTIYQQVPLLPQPRFSWQRLCEIVTQKLGIDTVAVKSMDKTSKESVIKQVQDEVEARYNHRPSASIVKRALGLWLS
jgi:hypothetical protein